MTRAWGSVAKNTALLFDAFYTTKDPEHGTGLGLSVSRTIIEEIGGTLELLSDGPSKGARAVVRLPVAKEPDAREPDARESVDEKVG